MYFVPLDLLRMQELLREDRERGSGRGGLDSFCDVDCLYDPCIASGDL